MGHTASLALSDDQLQKFQYSSADDPVVQVLWETIRHGWSENKSNVLKSIHAYYDFFDELTIQDQLVLKGDCLVVPAILCVKK